MKFGLLVVFAVFSVGANTTYAGNPCCQPIEIVGKKPPTQVDDPGYLETWKPEPTGIGGGFIANNQAPVTQANDAVLAVCRRGSESAADWLERAVAVATAANLERPAVLSMIKDIAQMNVGATSFPLIGAGNISTTSRASLNPEPC